MRKGSFVVQLRAQGDPDRFFFGFQTWIRIQAAVGRSHSYYAGQNIDSTSTLNSGS
jgi:hypothetical protein